MKVALAVAASMLIMGFSFDVQAFPGSPHQTYEAPSVTLVMGCGKGVPRTKEGGCALAGQTRTVAPASSGVNGTVCPPGTRLNMKGNCVNR
jgi:hypothetical protein